MILKKASPSLEIRAWKNITISKILENHESIARDASLKKVSPSLRHLKTMYIHLQRCELKKGFTICKRCELGKSYTISKRCELEKSFPISKRCELEKQVIISMEMVAGNLRHHLNGDDTLFFCSSPRDAILRYKKSSPLEMRSWKLGSISIWEMIPYILGSNLWRWSREIVLIFQSCFIPGLRSPLEPSVKGNSMIYV